MSGSPIVLSVHAVDPCGEEGILADAATIRGLGCRPAYVATGILFARRSLGIAIEALPLPLVVEQFEAALAAAPAAAVRIGILADALQADTVATLVRDSGARNVVVAPVVRSSGTTILDEPTLETVRRRLFPLARVVIARASDLPSLTGEKAGDLKGLERAAAKIRSQGARAALVAGGGWGERVVDVLDDEGQISMLDVARVAAPRVVGLADAHPTAVAAFLARGESLVRSADAAQRHVGMRLDGRFA